MPLKVSLSLFIHHPMLIAQKNGKSWLKLLLLRAQDFVCTTTGRNLCAIIEMSYHVGLLSWEQTFQIKIRQIGHSHACCRFLSNQAKKSWQLNVKLGESC